MALPQWSFWQCRRRHVEDWCERRELLVVTERLRVEGRGGQRWWSHRWECNGERESRKLRESGSCGVK